MGITEGSAMDDPLQIRVADLRRAAETLLDHLQEIEGDIVEVPDHMFWAVPAEARHNVYEQPSTLTIGQLSESWANVVSMTKSDENVLSYGLVWFADIVRAIGEQTVG
jgi:hypothetical protein